MNGLRVLLLNVPEESPRQMRFEFILHFVESPSPCRQCVRRTNKAGIRPRRAWMSASYCVPVRAVKQAQKCRLMSMPAWNGLPICAKVSFCPVAPLSTAKVLYLVSVRLRAHTLTPNRPKSK